jgi:hypothetical protein
VEVVDNLRAAGVDQLGLLTEQLQEKGKADAACGAGCGDAGEITKDFKGVFLWECQSVERAVRKAIST